MVPMVMSWALAPKTKNRNNESKNPFSIIAYVCDKVKMLYFLADKITILF